MATHRALIVDDSKTAQHRLKRMLKKYDLDIDLANSAEEALGYLTHTMPSVIFMDHHMEGMDGLEALKIIKANPSTAVIPVIMYTSQSGDVYVGRAHALGALDILSKEVIKAANLEAVLGKLKIEKSEIPPEEDNTESTSDQSEDNETLDSNVTTDSPDTNNLDNTENETVIVKPAESPSEKENTFGVATQVSMNEEASSELKNQVARLFELHIADVRTQITENTKFMIRRLTSEIKTATSEIREEQEKEAKIEAENTLQPKEPELTVGNFLAPVLLGIVLIIALVVCYQVFKLSEQQLKTEQALEQIQSFRPQSINTTNVSNIDDFDDYSLEPIYDSYEILEVVSLATEFETNFAFNQNPFEDDNLSVLLGIVERLDTSGFKGLIEVAIHTGNFCVVADADGSWALAPEESLIGSCTFSETEPNTLLEEWTTDAYEQLEILAIPIQQNDIELIFVAQEEDPRIAYPEEAETLKAGEWNAIATLNNFINIRLESQE